MQPTGEAEVGGVLQADRVVEIVGSHDPQHRTEALGAMEPRSALYARPHARRPEPTGQFPVDRQQEWLDQPVFSIVEFGQRPSKRSARFADDGPDDGVEIGRRPDTQAPHCVA